MPACVFYAVPMNSHTPVRNQRNPEKQPDFAGFWHKKPNEGWICWILFIFAPLKSKPSMNQAQRETEFVIFCIENTALRLGVSGAEVYRELQQANGISGYLYPSFPTLHTQSKEYIVDEIIQYLARINPAFVRKKGAVA